MKQVILLRHAKSSWSDITCSDFDRPLNHRGKKDAESMASKLTQRIERLDLLMSSTANRAKSTTDLFIYFGLQVDKVEYMRELYHASPEQIINQVNQIHPSVQSVMIVAHNPSLTILANDLIHNFQLDNLPTSGIVSIQFDVEEWSEVGKCKGNLLFIDFPKKYSEQAQKV